MHSLWNQRRQTPSQPTPSSESSTVFIQTGQEVSAVEDMILQLITVPVVKYKQSAHSACSYSIHSRIEQPTTLLTTYHIVLIWITSGKDNADQEGIDSRKKMAWSVEGGSRLIKQILWQDKGIWMTVILEYLYLMCSDMCQKQRVYEHIMLSWK